MCIIDSHAPDTSGGPIVPLVSWQTYLRCGRDWDQVWILGSPCSNLIKPGEASIVETDAVTDMDGKHEGKDGNGIRVERKFQRDEEQV
jgi:hypothetical protein